MTVIIQLSAVGINITLFDIYSNIDYGTPIVTGISKMQLLAGYSLLNVPDNATTIRLSSTGNCSTYTDIAIGGLTTTTTTAIPTTTTTTLNCSFIVNAQEITTTSTTSTTTTAAPPVNSVEWLTGDYPPTAYGISPGDIINLSGTLEIIGNSVTFRAYAFLLTGPGDGGVDTSINIGNIDVGITSRYVDAVTPYDNGITQYSTSFILPAGIYDWSVLCTFSNTASVGGEGGIDWVQA